VTVAISEAIYYLSYIHIVLGWESLTLSGCAMLRDDHLAHWDSDRGNQRSYIG